MKSIASEVTVPIAEGQEEYETVHGHYHHTKMVIEEKEVMVPSTTMEFELTDEEVELIVKNRRFFYSQLGTPPIRPFSFSIEKPY